MKFTVSQKILCAALARIQGIAVARATMPILANVLLCASGLRPVLHVTASDLEVSYSTVIDCTSIDEHGSITVPAKKLYEVVKAAPTGEILFTLDADNLRLTVCAGTYVAILAGYEADGFPVITPVSGDDLQLDGAALLRLIDHVDYAQSSDETKYNLAGTFLKIVDSDDDCRLHAVSTDGHRLAADSVPLPGAPRLIPADLLRGIIVPRKGISELKKIKAEGVLVLQISGNNLSVSTDNELIHLRLIDGQFPDYGRIFPTEFLGTVETNHLPLIDALQRVQLLSSGKEHPVTLEFVSGAVHLKSKNVELGEACDKVSAAIEWHDDSVEGYSRRVNAAYLIQALSAMDAGLVQIKLPGLHAPLLLAPICETEPCAVVMSMRD